MRGRRDGRLRRYNYEKFGDSDDEGWALLGGGGGGVGVPILL
jgi:hypothetical protein